MRRPARAGSHTWRDHVVRGSLGVTPSHRSPSSSSSSSGSSCGSSFGSRLVGRRRVAFGVPVVGSLVAGSVGARWRSVVWSIRWTLRFARHEPVATRSAAICGRVGSIAPPSNTDRRMANRDLFDRPHAESTISHVGDRPRMRLGLARTCRPAAGRSMGMTASIPSARDCCRPRFAPDRRHASRRRSRRRGRRSRAQVVPRAPRPQPASRATL